VGKFEVSPINVESAGIVPLMLAALKGKKFKDALHPQVPRRIGDMQTNNPPFIALESP
jgi:hypothetical protein